MQKDTNVYSCNTKFCLYIYFIRFFSSFLIIEEKHIEFEILIFNEFFNSDCDYEFFIFIT